MKRWIGFSSLIFLALFSRQALAIVNSGSGGGACTGTATASASDTTVTSAGGVRLTGSLSVSGGAATNVTYKWTYTGECSTKSSSGTSSSTTFTPSYNGVYNIGLAISFTCNTGNYTASDSVSVTFNVGSYASCSSGSATADSTGVVYDTPGQANGVVVSGDYTYVADGSSGLQIINVSNPASPTLAGSYNGDSAQAVFVSGNAAYTVGSKLDIINISNPAAPTLAGSYDLKGFSYAVYVTGNYAYVAESTAGIEIINISNSASPTLAGSYATGGYAEDVFVTENYAYVADYRGSGLVILNVSNPASPTLVGTFSGSTGNYTKSVFVRGNYAYVIDEGGLEVVNISTPASPALMGNYPNFGDGVFVSGKDAYILDGYSGVTVASVADPTNPVYKASYATTDSAEDVFVSGDYVYVAANRSGLEIFTIPGLVKDYGDVGGDAFVVYYLEGENRFVEETKEFYNEFFAAWPDASLLPSFTSDYTDANTMDDVPAPIESYDLAYHAGHSSLQSFVTDDDYSYVYLNSSSANSAAWGQGDLEYFTLRGCQAGSANYCDGMSAVNRYTASDSRSSIFAGLHTFSGMHGTAYGGTSSLTDLGKYYARYLRDGLTLSEAWMDANDDIGDWRSSGEKCAKVADDSNCDTEDFDCQRWDQYASTFYIDSKKNETINNRASYSSDPRKGDADYDVDLIYEYQSEQVPIYTEGHTLP